ncbi:hypothetical protein [Vibrio sp. 10N.239.312.D08]|uniref:hypothetical protein n=1 Tax=Vibrio sp. 10N.239.312.D08 TaxID=3229978 RepID=UPI00354E6019
MIKSTCLHFEDTKLCEQAISYLLKSETQSSRIEVLSITLKLHHLGSEFVAVDDVLKQTRLARSTVAAVFSYLSQHQWFDTEEANKRVAAGARTKLIFLKPLSEIELTEETDSVANPARFIRVETLDRHIPHPQITFNDLDDAQIALPYTHTFSTLTAPGRERVYEMRAVRHTHGGEAYVNKVTSAVGVVNDYAQRVRQILLQLSYHQITQNLQYHCDNPAVNPRFMIRMIDIIKSGNFSTNERTAISEAIDQNRQSIYTIRENPFLEDDKVITDQFSFLTHLKGISAKEGGLEESQHPYIAVSIEWDAAITGYLKANKLHFIQNKHASTLPPLFSRLYQTLRVIYFSNSNADLRSSLFYNEKLNILELTKIVWENVHETGYHKTIVKDLIGELKLKSLNRINHETFESVDIIEIDLFGFAITFCIPRFHNPRGSANLTSLVHITVDEKRAIEVSGAKYNPGVNNLPTRKNPNRSILMEEPQVYRHVLPEHIRKLDSLFSFKNARSSYYLKFVVKDVGQEYLITRYHDPMELEVLYESIAVILGSSASDVNLFLDAKVRRLKLYNHLQTHEFQEALEISGLHKTDLLNLLINNLRSIPKMKSAKWTNLSEYSTS